eukprot:377479-Karenia_brevis.AAC.1
MLPVPALLSANHQIYGPAHCLGHFFFLLTCKVEAFHVIDVQEEPRTLRLLLRELDNLIATLKNLLILLLRELDILTATL